MFLHHRIRITLANAQHDGNTGSTGGAVFEGLRTSVRIQKSGGNFMGNAEVTIYGLSKDHVAQLSTWGTLIHPTKNYLISIQAGDDVNGMSTVFFGVVNQAWGDFTNMPNNPMYFLAVGTTAPMNVGTVDPTSAQGPTPIAPAIQKLSAAGGMTFENNGVNAVMDGFYHWGSPWKQIKELCDATYTEVFQDDGVVAIWPKDGARAGDTLFISRETGMRDYPSFTEYGVHVKVEFKRAVKYGTFMQIKSDLAPANGTWRILNINYDLESETPNGSWFTILDGISLGAPVTGFLK